MALKLVKDRAVETTKKEKKEGGTMGFDQMPAVEQKIWRKRLAHFTIFSVEFRAFVE